MLKLVSRTLTTGGIIAAGALIASVALGDGAQSPFGDTPLDSLIKFGAGYQAQVDESVSLDTLSKSTVTKIGYGISNTVHIATTPTGTYSTDGLTSPHVRYPGIEVMAPDSDSPLQDLFVAVGAVVEGDVGSFLAIGQNGSGNQSYAARTQLGFQSCNVSGSFLSCALD